MPTLTYHRYNREALREFVSLVLQSHGVPKKDANTAAKVLDCADHRGHPSHGVQRLQVYHEKLTEGETNPKPNIIVERGGLDRQKAAATINGDNGLGLVVGPWSMRYAIETAAVFGTSSIAVNNSNHFGTAAFYVLEAMKAEMIGEAQTTTTPLTAAFGSTEKFFGTDAFAVGAPGGKERGLVSDMATSVAAVGKMELCIRCDLPIPGNWAFGPDKKPTFDPIAGRKGALRPMGSDKDHAGHKGTCLATVVQIFCGLLSGANWGPHTPRFTLALPTPQTLVGKGTGHYFGATDIEVHRDTSEFKAQVDRFIAEYMSLPADDPSPGAELAHPGLVEWRAEEKNATHVDVVQAVVDNLADIAKATGVHLPASDEIEERVIGSSKGVTN